MRSVKVNRKAADRIASGHPWIFASDIVDRDGAEAGEAVQVFDFRNRAARNGSLQFLFPNHAPSAVKASRRSRLRISKRSV